MTRVKIETTVELTPELMAQAFARMKSDEQANFLSTCWRELVEVCGGAAGAERQMVYVYSDDAFDILAREMIEALSPLPDELQAPLVSLDTEKPASHSPEVISYVRTATEELAVREELAKRDAKAREVVALIPHVAVRWMDAYTEVDVLDPDRQLAMGSSYYLQRFPIGTVTCVDEGRPGDVRQVTVRLDAVLPDLPELPCAVPPTCGQRFDNVEPRFSGTYRQPIGAQAEAREHRVCPECRGTGWYLGFSKRERCSKGCAC